MKMPFGKHKGEDLMDVPTEYIKWVCLNVDLRKNQPLLGALENQLKIRDGEGVSR